MPRLFLRLLVLGALLSVARAEDDFRVQIGYDRLVARLGGFVPAGSSVAVGQMEAYEAGGYLPNFINPVFTGINFNLVDGPSVPSVHAEIVGAIFYGRGLSLAPGISTVKLFLADLQGGFLVSSAGLDPSNPAGPKDPGVKVINHSWVMNPSDAVQGTQLLRRLDWLADAYDVVMVGGLPNDADIYPPVLQSSGFNQIVVGNAYTGFSNGPTAFLEADGFPTAGRSKPDLVAPLPYSSWNTPLVSACAALLIDDAHLRLGFGNPRFANGDKAVVIKSVLQTSAEKLPGCAKGNPGTTSDDESVPLDRKQGAGELDIDQAEQVLSVGDQSPGWIGHTGWSYQPSLGALSQTFYYFVLNEPEVRRFAATLNWNRKIRSTGTPSTTDVAELPNLDLELYSYDGTNYTLVQASRSPIDNVEHLHVPAMPNGFYILRVLNYGPVSTDFALSWARLP